MQRAPRFCARRIEEACSDACQRLAYAPPSPNLPSEEKRSSKTTFEVRKTSEEVYESTKTPSGEHETSSKTISEVRKTSAETYESKKTPSGE